MQSRLARIALVFLLVVVPAWAWVAYLEHELKASCRTPPCPIFGDWIVLYAFFIAGVGAIPVLIVLGVADRRRARGVPGPSNDR